MHDALLVGVFLGLRLGVAGPILLRGLPIPYDSLLAGKSRGTMVSWPRRIEGAPEA